MKESGKISIHTDNILPIIKKWLYSDKDIFIRELVSNGCDAIQKLEKIALVEEVEKDSIPEPKVSITINKEQKTITIEDTGLGMTDEEVKKYINQVAFSGVSDFVEKYQTKDDADQIIGHFGLGFYSSFIISHKVEIETKSYLKDSKPVHWSSEGNGDFEISEGTRETTGTLIRMHVSTEELDFLDVGKIRTIASKYCAFMRYPIYLQEELISDTKPLWTLNPSTLKDEDYKTFFSKCFPMSQDPLFWIHLNVDYPFKLRGILYFPKLSHEFESSEGQVKLFCNQVFVEDNCKELVPDFLTLLKGAIDCPDLPLNVSRSALQKDQTVQKITQHIVKKIADKLTGLFKTSREEYIGFWKDINPFVKYGMMRDRSFSDKVMGACLFSTTSGEYKNFDEYLEKNGAKTDQFILYVPEASRHSASVRMLESDGIEVVLTEKNLDQHFLPFVEMNSSMKYKFKRVDGEVFKSMTSTESAAEIVDPRDQKTPSEKLLEVYRATLAPSDKLEIKVDSLKDPQTPAIMVVDEQARRMQELAKRNPMFALAGSDVLEPKRTLVLNKNATANKRILELSRTLGREADVRMMIEHIHDLATLQCGEIRPLSMKSFMDRTVEILGKI